MLSQLTNSEKKHLLAVVSADFDYLNDLCNALNGKIKVNSMTPEEMKEEAIAFIVGDRKTISEQTRAFMSTILPYDARWQKHVSKRIFGFTVGDILTKLRICTGRAGSDVLASFAKWVGEKRK